MPHYETKKMTQCWNSIEPDSIGVSKYVVKQDAAFDEPVSWHNNNFELCYAFGATLFISLDSKIRSLEFIDLRIIFIRIQLKNTIGPTGNIDLCPPQHLTVSHAIIARTFD